MFVRGKQCAKPLQIQYPRCIGAYSNAHVLLTVPSSRPCTVPAAVCSLNVSLEVYVKSAESIPSMILSILASCTYPSLILLHVFSHVTIQRFSQSSNEKIATDLERTLHPECQVGRLATFQYKIPFIKLFTLRNK